MFIVKRDKDVAIVRGPEGYEKIIPKNSIGFVIRLDIENEIDPMPRRYVISCNDITDAEIVGVALEENAYPSC